MKSESVSASNGFSIPTIGLGTWQSAPGLALKAVEHALRVGYRNLDCAWIYRNEAEVGQAVRASGVPRNDIVITSKLWNSFHRPEHVPVNLDMTLKALNTPYLDLYLMHWHVAFGLPPSGNPTAFPKRTDGKRLIDWGLTNDFMPTWRAMETLVDEGKVKHIGVSNFNLRRMKHLQRHARIQPSALQVEINWSWPQHELVQWCQENGIIVEAYSPLENDISKARFMSDPTIKQVANELKCTAPEVVIAWLVRRGLVVLVKSVNPSRIESNLKVVPLSDAQFSRLQEASRSLTPRRVLDPGPEWGIHDLYEDNNVHSKL